MANVDKEDGIVYLISGRKHAVVLVASIVSLRRHWGGSITVVGTDDAGYEFACKLGDDSRLDVISKRMEHGNQKRNSGYLNKTRIESVLDYDRMIFLDADTIVCGDVSEVFPRGDEMVLTSWAGWVTTGRRMGRRIKKWSGVEPDRVSRMLSVPWAAINTGVFGFTKNTKFMEDWFTVTSQKVSFMCDEIAAQIMYPDYPVRLLTDKYNCSPIYGQKKDEAVVWHFHGKKHCRAGSVELWFPVFQECMDSNFAGVSEWCPAGDKRLRNYLGDSK